MPTAGQAWSGDPWTLRTSGSRVIGRGATDMKGFLACCLSALPGIAARPLKRPSILPFPMTRRWAAPASATWRVVGRSNLAPRMAIIGEPTGMDLVSAHKGGLIGWAKVRGKPGHSSQPDRYVNAVMAAADLIGEINRIRVDMRSGPQFDGLDPPYSTIQVNQIKGGLHGNIVAEACDFFWECGSSRRRRSCRARTHPALCARGDRACHESGRPGLRHFDRGAGTHSRPEARSRNTDAAAPRTPGQAKTPLCLYGTEAGIFQLNGTPSFVIGPGDIGDAHQPDEGIEIAELERCVAFPTASAKLLR